MQLDHSEFSRSWAPSLWCKVVLILSMDRPSNVATYEDPSRFYSHGLNFKKKNFLCFPSCYIQDISLVSLNCV
jgi:hypothetical protein